MGILNREGNIIGYCEQKQQSFKYVCFSGLLKSFEINLHCDPAYGAELCSTHFLPSENFKASLRSQYTVCSCYGLACNEARSSEYNCIVGVICKKVF